jgi:predicted anti-sigma-YlaC factor YlaD
MNAVEPSEPCADWTDELAHCLDGLPPRPSFAGHLAQCADCRSWLAAGQLLLHEGLPALVVPADLADRVFQSVRADQRQRTRTRWLVYAGAGLAAAASVLAMLWYPTPTPPPVVVAPAVPVAGGAPPVEPPTLQDQWHEATAAVAALTRRAADEALPSLPATPLPTTLAWQPNLAPAEHALHGASNAAAEGLEPMTRGARRAFEWLLKDAALIHGE